MATQDALRAQTPSAWLTRNREPLLRRWLSLIVERASLDELAERPLGERIKDLDLLLEAASGSDQEAPTALRTRGDSLWDELERQVDAHRRLGSSFALAIVAVNGGGAGIDGAATPNGDDFIADDDWPPTASAIPIPGPSDWAVALRQAATADDVVVDAGDGATALVLPGAGTADARLAADRLRVSAWKLLGGRGRLADVGLASCPEDGAIADELVTVARERLRRALGGPLEAADVAELAPVTPLFRA